MNSDGRWRRIQAVLLVSMGAFLGTTLRYGVDVLVDPTYVATVCVNVVGCVGMGWLLYSDQLGRDLSTGQRLAIGSGLLSSFTTYSTFVLDIVSSDPLLAVPYFVLSYGLGFAAIVGGKVIATSTWRG